MTTEAVVRELLRLATPDPMPGMPIEAVAAAVRRHRVARVTRTAGIASVLAAAATLLVSGALSWPEVGGRGGPDAVPGAGGPGGTGDIAGPAGAGWVTSTWVGFDAALLLAVAGVIAVALGSTSTRLRLAAAGLSRAISVGGASIAALAGATAVGQPGSLRSTLLAVASAGLLLMSGALVAEDRLAAPGTASGGYLTRWLGRASTTVIGLLVATATLAASRGTDAVLGEVYLGPTLVLGLAAGAAILIGPYLAVTRRTRRPVAAALTSAVASGLAVQTTPVWFDHWPIAAAASAALLGLVVLARALSRRFAAAWGEALATASGGALGLWVLVVLGMSTGGPVRAWPASAVVLGVLLLAAAAGTAGGRPASAPGAG